VSHLKSEVSDIVPEQSASDETRHVVQDSPRSADAAPTQTEALRDAIPLNSDSSSHATGQSTWLLNRLRKLVPLSDETFATLTSLGVQVGIYASSQASTMI